MADHHRCPACCASVPRRAGFCPTCGTAVDAPALPIETASAFTGGFGHEVALGAGRANRKRSALAAASVVAVVVVGGLVVGAGDGGAGKDASPPSTTARAITTPAPPIYTAAPMPELEGAGLYAVVDDHVVRIDTTTGAAVELGMRSRRSEGEWRHLIPRHGGVVANTGATLMFLPDDASEAVLLGEGQALAASDSTLVWIWPGFVSTVGLEARLVRIDTGDEIATVELPAAASPTGDDGTGRLAVTAAGGSYTIDPHGGTVDRLSSGKLVTVTATHFVQLRCDEQLACVNELVDRATGSAAPIPLDDRRLGVCAQLAPTVDRLVATSYDDLVHLHVIQLDTGSLQVLGGMSGPCPSYSWTADGRHLVWASRGVTVWTVGRDQPKKYHLTDGRGHRVIVAEVALTLPVA